MDEKTAWDVYFAGICSIRFHPKNDDNHPAESEVAYAATVADLMMRQRKKRWERGQQQQRQQ